MSGRAWANDPRGLFPSILIVFKRKSILFGLHGEIPHEIPLPAIILEDYAVDNLNKYYIRRALSIANQLVSSSSLMDMFGLAGMTLITNVHLVFSLVQLCLKTQVLLLFPFVCKMISRRYLVTHWFELRYWKLKASIMMYTISHFPVTNYTTWKIWAVLVRFLIYWNGVYLGSILVAVTQTCPKSQKY